MSPVARAGRSSPRKSARSRQDPLPDTWADLETEVETDLSRLAAFVHQRVPGSAAVVVAVRVGGRVHVGGHGPEAGRVVGQGAEGPCGPSRVTLVDAGGEDRAAQDDLFWSPSPERLARVGVSCVATFPLRAGRGLLVGSLSVLADSPAELPRREDVTFDDVLRRLAAAVSSVRQSAVARSNTVLLRGGPAAARRVGPCPPR